MGPCNGSSTTNRKEAVVSPPTTSNTANKSKALALYNDNTKQKLKLYEEYEEHKQNTNKASRAKRPLFQDNGDNVENKETRIAKKPRESVGNNTVVRSDNEESKEDWSVVFKFPCTKLAYSEQHLAERWVDKEDKSMVKSN